MRQYTAENWDFFNDARLKTTVASESETIKAVNAVPEEQLYPVNARDAQMSENRTKLLLMIENVKEVLKKYNQNTILPEIEKLEHSLHGDEFKISVVGEMCRGKSTLINELIGRDVLPVGPLPVTALLTKLTYNPNEMIVYVNGRGIKRTLPLKAQSWNGLVAQLGKQDPHGVVFVGLDDPWLSDTGFEIIDTPGAGDLDQRRALLVNDALLCGDGAIITISALQALSISEKEFIEQRLLAAKIPNMILVVTHLDAVASQERVRIFNYIKGKLELWGFPIPVFISREGTQIPGMDCTSFTGANKIKAELERWLLDEDFYFRKRANVCTSMLSILNIACAAAGEKERLLRLDANRRNEVLARRNDQIAKAKLAWEDVRLGIFERGNTCYEWMKNNVNEKTEMLIERLQYEASHANNPQKWWTEDYPYRLKVELSQIANALENGLSNRYAQDMRWANQMLEKQFNASVFVEKEERFTDTSDYPKDTISDAVTFESIEKQRAWMRIGTGAAMIGGFALFAASGLLPIAATVGIGTSGTLISDKIFKDKIEKQQRAVIEAIRKDIPRVVDEALSVCEKRLQAMYLKLEKEATAKEKIWEKAQFETLRLTDSAEEKGLQYQMETREAIERLISTINDFMEV